MNNDQILQIAKISREISEDVMQVINAHIKLLNNENDDLTVGEVQVIALTTAQMITSSIVLRGYALEIEGGDTCEKAKKSALAVCTKFALGLKNIITSEIDTSQNNQGENEND